MKAVVTYLNFDGNTKDAMKFYARSLGGELSMMPFSEMPGDYPKEAKDRVMHSRITKGDSVLLMASDTMPGHGFTQGTNFSVSVHCESQEEIDRLFAAFSENAKKITMPLQDAFWGARFGMLTDQFGVNWMFNFEKQKQ